MKIPPFWARARYEGQDEKGSNRSFLASGWSFTSLEEASGQARDRAKRMFEAITSGKKPLRYEYHDRPIREEMLSEINREGEVVAVITRNRYGALVLNCVDAMFVDVDFQTQSSGGGFFDGLALAFSRKKREEKKFAEELEQTRHVVDWAAANPQHSFRLYRTKAGLRLLFTDRLYEPGSDEVQGIMRSLNADPLYMKLTEKQECFRARLTSKPWRCEFHNPPVSFPWVDEAAEAKMRKWEADYTAKDVQYKTCDLINEFGGPVLPELQSIVDGHDRACGIHKDAVLA